MRHEPTTLVAAARRQQRIQDGTAMPQDIELERRDGEVTAFMTAVGG